MATYRLKRKTFSVNLSTVTKAGGDVLDKLGKGNKTMGAITAVSLGTTAMSGKNQRAEQEAQNRQALKEQKDRIDQLNSIAKS